MGCVFCASTLNGLIRNLSAAEMLEQIYRIQCLTGERVSHVVVMGSGEPFDNYENFLRFVKLVTDRNGLNISQRNITVSTCGLIPQIRRLAEENLQITLALSLHAPNDKVRRSLMPIAAKYPLSQLLSVCDYYFERTGRRVTFEYSLVNQVNDTLKEAAELCDLIKSRNSHSAGYHVNLIPVNPIKERHFIPSDRRNIENFKNLLEKNGINVTIRREMGRDIEGACGQLRMSYLEETVVGGND